jgi:hypothetical protein
VGIPDFAVAQLVVEEIRDPVPRMLAQFLLRSGLRLNEATPVDTTAGLIGTSDLGAALFQRCERREAVERGAS